jgi:hypothetical protein
MQTALLIEEVPIGTATVVASQSLGEAVFDSYLPRVAPIFDGYVAGDWAFFSEAFRGWNALP